MLTMRPQPLAIRCGVTTCETRNVPLTLTCTDSCQMYGLDSQNGRKFPAGGRPGPRTGRRALLTRTCSLPKWRMLSASSRSQSVRTVMSIFNGSARPGPALASISAATASSRSISGAASTTRAPAFASASDMDLPRPRLAPVMATTVPSRSMLLVMAGPYIGC